MLDLWSRILVLPFFALSFASYSQQSPHETAEEYFELGENEYRKSNWITAESFYDSCLAIVPNHFDAHYSRAIARENSGNLEGAISDYGILVHLNPEFTEGWWARGQLRFQIQHYAQAYEDFYALLRLPEDETNAVFFRRRYPDEGVSAIATLETMRSEIFNYLGLTAEKLDQDAVAILHFDKAVELDFDNADYYVNRSWVYEKMGSLESAKIDLERAIQIDPDNTLAKYNLARIQEANASHDQLIATYDDILIDQPGFSEAFAKRGLAKMNTGDFEGALSDYDSAIYYKSDNALLWMNRGIIRMQTADLPGAFSDLTKAIELRPSLEEAYLNRGNALMKLKRYDEAVLDYDRALLYYPELAMAYYNRGVAQYNMAEIELACKDIRRAVELGMPQAERTLERMCGGGGKG